jgi:diguanylate cyclase (GGDEF)-like protein
MQLYATNDDIARLEDALLGLAGPARAGTLVQLAWHLRQRDIHRAVILAKEAESQAVGAGPSIQMWLLLTRAECALHGAQLDLADKLAAQASTQALDDVSSGDAAHLRARIREARGQRDDELAFRHKAIEFHRASGDRERYAHARAALLLSAGFGDPVHLGEELRAIRAEFPEPSRALSAHFEFVDGIAAFQRGAFLDAVPILAKAHAECDAAGLIEQSLRAGLGLASAYSNLGDREACCNLCESLLARTRLLGWPRMVSHALANLARQLADSGEAQNAVELLHEARELIADQPRSRGFAIATYYLGDALLALGKNDEALQYLKHSEDLMRDLGAKPEIACLQAVEAQALSRLGRPEQALARAESALAIARESKARLWEVEALRSLAEIHATHCIAAPDGTRAEALPVRLLDEALAVVKSIGGHHEKSQLYAEIARAHEANGDIAAALSAERTARAEQTAEAHIRAANIALLAQVRYQTEQQRLEVQHQHSLLEAEAARAKELEASLETLAHLGHIGQQITARHDVESILNALQRHVGNMADMHYIGVSLLNKDGTALRRRGLENGQPIADVEFPLNDPASIAARCARERREILIEREEGELATSNIPGTLPSWTLWFGPLIAQDKLLGVLTIQSRKVRAYGERELLVFRTLSAYAAVALANAEVYRELEAANARLRMAEAELRALATTDSLTGIPNRRSFLAGAEAELERSRRTGKLPALILGDLDSFKKINDTLGHPAGDMVLTAVAVLLATLKRNIDTVGRMGGEEFALLLPESDLEAAIAAAERLRQAIEDAPLMWEGRHVSVTMSFGCAVLAREGPIDMSPAEMLFEELFKLADQALYDAKHQGRNRIVGRVGR